ncbi:MAG: signal peptidase II [Planctomycetota bacterium]
MRPTTGWPLFLTVTAAAAGLDLVTKSAVFARLGMPGTGPRVVFIPDVFVLETNLNEGALFGLGQGLSWLFAAVSVAALAGIMAMVSRPATRESCWLVWALALICGGILGNLYDRLGLPGLTWHAPADRVGQPVYAVRDWIHVMVPGVIDWPIFNLADSWLVIGAGMLLVASLGQPPAVAEQPPRTD